MTVRLPVLQDEPASSLRADGRRNHVHPADVDGRFTRRRRWIFRLLIAILVAIPFVRIDGHPAVYLDVARGRFFLGTASLNAQDFWLSFFVLSGVAFALIVATSLFGRVFCGYACPHTVFLEGLYRPIERFLEGPRNERMRRNAGPATPDKVARKVAKYAAFVGLSALLAHTFLSYFVSLPTLLVMVRQPPSAHPEAFAWTMSLTALLTFHFAIFREQLCLVVCPYGRLQSALVDEDTLVIGYDVARGEPRGRVGTEGAGDCVDCRRCVVVCPTGIDIRNGLQMECVGCAACVDACDAVMEKLGRAPGLVRYDSPRGLAGGPRRFVRPRLALYAVLGVAGLVVATLAFRTHAPFEASLRRAAGAPFLVVGDEVVTPLRVHLVNKLASPQTLHVTASAPPAVRVEIDADQVVVGPHASRYVSIVARVARDAGRPGDRLEIVVTSESDEKPERISVPLLGPGR